MTETAVYAAGAVVWKLIDDKLHVLLIHRTKYRDLTIPKGKVDPGETLPETAVREVFEETGVRVSLGAPIGVSKYRLPSRKRKIVHYWAAEATEEAVQQSAFVPNREVSGVEWMTPKKALASLSYPVDVEIMEQFLGLVRRNALRTFPVIVLRHAKAIARTDWDGADALRPLSERGKRQAKEIAGALAAFGVKKLVSSPALRCLDTLKPLAKDLGKEIRTADNLSQDALDAGTADIRKEIGKRVRKGKPVVLATHRPAMPAVMRELALATGTVETQRHKNAATLEAGAFSVIHLSADHPGSGIVAIETYVPRV